MADVDPRPRRPMFTARIEKSAKGPGKLVIEIDLEEPRPSASGKTLVVASSHGNQVSRVTVNGQPVVVGVNCHIRNSK